MTASKRTGERSKTSISPSSSSSETTRSKNSSRFNLSRARCESRMTSINTVALISMTIIVLAIVGLWETSMPSNTGVGSAVPKSPMQFDCLKFLAAEAAAASSSSSDHLANPFEMVSTRTPVPFNMSIYPQENDVFVSGSIKQWGCWECHIIKTVVETLRQHADSALLDMGGNIGMMALSAAAAGHDVYVWEPFRANFRHLCRSVGANVGFSDRIHLFNWALTRRETVVHFRDHQGTNNQGGIGVSDAAASNATTTTMTLTENVDYARGIPVDKMLPWLPPPGRPLVIKVDVEASEMEALAGAMEYLRQHQGNILLVTMEVNQRALLGSPDDADSIFQFFKSNGLKATVDGVPLVDDWRNWKDSQGNSFGVLDVMWIKQSEPNA